MGNSRWLLTQSRAEHNMPASVAAASSGGSRYDAVVVPAMAARHVFDGGAALDSFARPGWLGDLRFARAVSMCGTRLLTISIVC